VTHQQHFPEVQAGTVRGSKLKGRAVESVNTLDQARIVGRILPRYVLITEARRSDVKMADAFTLKPGSIVAMDRGYNDYGLFFKWTTEEIFFVTRLKENAAYEVVEELAVPKDRNI
jgi:hypothetical protein